MVAFQAAVHSLDDAQINAGREGLDALLVVGVGVHDGEVGWTAGVGGVGRVPEEEVLVDPGVQPAVIEVCREDVVRDEPDPECQVFALLIPVKVIRQPGTLSNWVTVRSSFLPSQNVDAAGGPPGGRRRVAGTEKDLVAVAQGGAVGRVVDVGMLVPSRST